MAATKHDGSKPSLSLIPTSAIWGTAAALTFGKKKYGQWNFKQGMAHTRLSDAALRHITQWLNGEDYDSESGLKHLYHALASLSMLVDIEELHPELNDRYKAHDKKKKSQSGNIRARAAKGTKSRTSKRKQTFKKRK